MKRPIRNHQNISTMREVMQFPLQERLAFIASMLHCKNEEEKNRIFDEVIFMDSSFIEDVHCTPNKQYQSQSNTKTQNKPKRTKV